MSGGDWKVYRMCPEVSGRCPQVSGRCLEMPGRYLDVFGRYPEGAPKVSVRVWKLSVHVR